MESGLGPTLARAKLGFAMLGLFFYAALLASVRNVLFQDRNVDSRKIAHGPLLRLYIVLAYISLIFILGVFEAPAANSE